MQVWTQNYIKCVKTAFLNREFDKEIYIEQPIGYIIQGQEQKVCKLLKSIYSLKKYSRQWNIQFHNVVMSHNFEMIEEDHCVYIKSSKNNFVILSLYVDDILIARNYKTREILISGKWQNIISVTKL